jgi:hypothetical protein
MVPYVFHPNAPLPCRERQIVFHPRRGLRLLTRPFFYYGPMAIRAWSGPVQQSRYAVCAEHLDAFIKRWTASNDSEQLPISRLGWCCA